MLFYVNNYVLICAKLQKLYKIINLKLLFTFSLLQGRNHTNAWCAQKLSAKVQIS